jgi:hypothetical protein
MIVLPLPAFVVTFLLLSLAVWLGATHFAGVREEAAAISEEFGVIQGATLTLLGLIVGFTFSMALDRYEQRKNFESAESAAIATAYARAELLPPPDAARVRALLVRYLDERVRYYQSRNLAEIAAIDRETGRLEAELWAAVRAPVLADRSSLAALVVEGVNDIVETQGDTQAAWRNRIPFAAWLLMGAIAFFATLLVGIGLRKPRRFTPVLAVLPLVVSIAFFLIADIESPRLGLISVVPENLIGLAETLRSP